MDATFISFTRATLICRVLALAFVASAGATLAQADSATDRLLLEQARTACRNQDYKALFNAIAGSAVVREHYSAAQISLQLAPNSTTQTLSKAGYTQFPIKILDYYYKPVAPVRAGDEDEYIQLEFNQSQYNQISVEWTRVHFVGTSEGGDDLGQAMTLAGQPYDPLRYTDGQLLFEPTQDCWELVADLRHAQR